MTVFDLIATLTLIFLVSATLLVLASRLGIPAIPLYLVAGVMVGAFIEEATLLDLAQWGIVFLVFAFAVELDPPIGQGLHRDSILVGIMQAALTGGIMFLVGGWLGFDTLNAVYFAIAATLSSTLVTLDILERRAPLRSLHERLAETIHLVEDAIAIVLLLLFSAFVYADGGPWAVGWGVVMIVLAVLIRRYLFDRLHRFAKQDVEIMMLTGISLIIGFLAFSELTGVSIAVGAFAAGLSVSSTYPHDVDVVDAIGYIEDFFAPLFFVTLGALVAIPTLTMATTSALLVLGVVIVNPLVIIAVLQWRGYDARTSLYAGMSLDHVSEFSLIIAIEALIVGTLAPELFDAIILATIITMFTTTLTDRFKAPAYQALVRSGLLETDLANVQARSNVQQGLQDHVVVTGYDQEGQRVVDTLEEIGQAYVVIESDPTRTRDVKARCENYVLGDPTARSAWQAARAENARLIVTTTAGRGWAEHALALHPSVDVFVHATNKEEGAKLLERGATFVSIPDVLAAQRLKTLIQHLLDEEITVDQLREQGQAHLDKHTPDPL